MTKPPVLLPEPATRVRLSVRRAGILFSVFFGASVTEAVSINLLPLSISLYTRDPNWIFCILAINPAFGLIAQPLTGLLSDRTWTRWGRRAVYLIVSAPLAAAGLLTIVFLDSLLWFIVVVVVVEFFQDVINGSDQPLIGDLVPPEQRTLALGLVKAAENLGFILVLFVGMPLVEAYRREQGDVRYGLPLYLAAAVCQLLFVAVAAAFLKEQPIIRQQRSRLSLKRYVTDFLDQPLLPRIAVAYFLRAFARSAVVGSVALYAHYTLRISEQEFGASWGLMPFVALTTGVPLGLMAERFAKQRVLQVAFTILITGCATGYLLRGTSGLVAASLIFGVGDMLLEVTHKALMSEFYPADLIGQLSGMINCFYAAGRMAGLVVVGQCVKLANPSVDWLSASQDAPINYDVMWLVSALAAVLGIVALSGVRDLRHEARWQTVSV
jgi:Na+/melibiose symporter-like transporter